MKYMKYINILFLLIGFKQQLISQSVLYPQSNYYITDTTNIKEYANKVFLRNILEDNQGNIYNYCSTYLGWFLEKRNILSGKSLWTNARNQNFPIKNTKDTYISKIAYLRSDGDIEVLGVKGYASFPPFVDDGEAIKAIYDGKTGEEKKFTFKKDNEQVFIDGGVFYPFIFDKERKQYYFLDFDVQKIYYAILSKLDSNMQSIDTLAYLGDGLNVDEPNISPLTMAFHEVNNNLYILSYLFGGKYDSTAHRHIFTKINKNTLQKKSIEISKELRYSLQNYTYTLISDGFLVTGYVDTALSIIDKKKKPYYEGMAAKVDTNGVLQWRIYLPTELMNKKYSIIQATQDKQRNGYWLLAGEDIKDSLLLSLYFINQKGNIVKSAKIARTGKGNDYFPNFIKSLSNGTLIVSLRYLICYNNFDTCTVNFTLKAAQLDNLLKEETQNSIIDNIFLQIYPNPANDNIVIDFGNSLSGALSVVNNLGQVLRNFNFEEQNTLNLSTAQYPNGIYFIHFAFKNGASFSQKVIIQH
jgi:hypothetical protein